MAFRQGLVKKYKGKAQFAVEIAVIEQLSVSGKAQEKKRIYATTQMRINMNKAALFS